MNSKSKVIPLAVLFLLSLALLVLSSTSNFFGIAPAGDAVKENFRWGLFESGSQELVTRRFDDAAQEGSAVLKKFGAYLAWHLPDGTIKAYTSQVGTQGFLMSLPVSWGWVTPAVAVRLYELICAILSALVLLAIPLWLQRHVNWKAAVVYTVLLFLSSWLTLYAKNLYWVIFLVYLPFVYGLWAYPKRLNGTLPVPYFYFGLYLLIVAKSLCGYEFISSVIMAPTVLAVFWGILANLSWKVIIREVLAMMLVGAVAVISVFGVHAIQHGLFANEWQLSKMPFVLRASDRGVIGIINPKTEDGKQGVSAVSLAEEASAKEQPAVKKSFLEQKIVFFKALISRAVPAVARHANDYLCQPALMVPFTGYALSFGWMFVLLIAFVVLLYLKVRSTPKSSSDSRLYLAMLISALYAPLCSFSWIVAGLEHFLGHKWLNEIIFYVPLLFWYWILITIYCADQFHWARKEIRLDVKASL